MAKTLNARVQTKHDIEDNWNQAINFIPKPGEIVIYETPSNVETRIITAKQAWQEKITAMNAIPDKSSEKYVQAKSAADKAEAKYRNYQASVVARFKVGNGTTKLIDLPFTSAPYVLKEEGKALSDHNYDDRAYNIIEGIKNFEDNNNDTLQYTDTKYIAGAGLALTEDNNVAVPPSSRRNKFNNTGVVSLTSGTINGTITMVKGNADGTTASTPIMVKGLGSAAYTSSEAYATAQQGARADSSVQKLDESATNGAITYSVFSADGTYKTTSVPIHGLKRLAYKDQLEEQDINLNVFPTFVGAHEESNENGGITLIAGERGMVPAPAADAGTYVLFGSGEWKPINNIALEADSTRGIAVNANNKFVNTGLLNASLVSDSDTGARSIMFSRLDENYNPGAAISITLDAPFVGAASDTDGLIGSVPTPVAGQQFYALFGDGKWGKISTNYTGTLTAVGWEGDAAPYTQTIAIVGLTSAMNCVVDIALPVSQTADENSECIEAWSLVDQINIDNGKITAYCYSDKPDKDLPLKLLAVK